MYSQTSNSQCTDPSVGQVHEKTACSDMFGTNAKDAHLISPGEHLDACQPCREAMIDHATQITLKEVATEKGLSVEEVIRELGLVAVVLQKEACERAVPLRVVVEEMLAR
jgi:hypothetical protein